MMNVFARLCSHKAIESYASDFLSTYCPLFILMCEMQQNLKEGSMKGQFLVPFIIWVLFAIIAITLWIIFDKIFYLFNFIYIGTCLA